MRGVKQYIRVVCLALATLVVSAGCIKENLDGCERCIAFEYFADGEVDLFAEHVERVHLYVFDQNDIMVPASKLGGGCNPIVLEKSDLEEYHGAKLLITGGTYRFVAVANIDTHEATEVYNLASGAMSEVYCSHPDCTTTEVEGNDPLLLGAKVVEIPDDTDFATKIRLYSARQKAKVTVKGYIGDEVQGIETKASSGDLALRLKNVSSKLDFYTDDPTATDQNLASGDLVTYSPVLTLDRETGYYEAEFYILRHTAESTLVFEIVEQATDRVLCSVSLQEFLREFYEVDITKQEVEIPLIIEFTDEVIVTIPSWMLEHRYPIYDKTNLDR